MFVCEEVGVAFLVGGWLAKADVTGTAVNAVWGLGLAIAYCLEGRKRARSDQVTNRNG